MTSEEIWKKANDSLFFIGAMFTWMQDKQRNPFVAVGSAGLKEMFPCFIGVDQKAGALIFQSEDEGIVGMHMERTDGKTIRLSMETGLTLEN